jgi:DNA-binding HxlR family transcriptional regulator
MEEGQDIERDRQRAEVFDSLGHPTRIVILKALNEGALGFADLKKKTSIDSSGQLQHHLNKLGDLIKTDEHGKYCLSDQGKDALLTVQTVEHASLAKKDSGKTLSRFYNSKKFFQVLSVLLAFLLIASTAIALVEFNQVQQLQTGPVAILNDPGYLNSSKLFLISAYSYYGKHDGQACFIIEATIRNDYTLQQLPPMDNFGGNSSAAAYFFLTAKLYVKNTAIQSEDVTSPGSPPSGLPQIGLGSGDTFMIEIDMATSNRNVASYTINLVGLAGYPIP